MKIKLQKPKNLAQNFDFKKSVDKAHKNIHRRSLTSTRRHIVGKADSIKNLRARKLVFSWSAKFLIVLVLGLLSYSKLNSAGRFTGFVGGGEVIAGIEDPNEQINLNPLTLSTPAESAVGRLIYSSILKYDQEGKLKGDLAKSYSIEDSGKKIRVRLKDNIKWHDKKSIVADDIVFTFTKLKDIRVNSSLRDSLNGVDVVALDNKNFEITSPRVVSGLDDLLTKIRIAPKHIFEGVDSDKISTVNYNKIPVGSGSFEIAGDVTSSAKTTLGINGPGSFQQVSLVPNMSYYDNSAQAKLTFRVFNTREDLNSAFNNGSIEMYIGSGNQINKNEDSEEAEIKLSSGVFSFFNLKSPYLSDIKLRRALSGYINRKSLSILNSGVKPLYSPILEVGDTEQPVINIEEAKKLIAEAGYTLDTNSNQFIKDGQPLRLNLVTGDSDEYSRVVDELAKTWKEIGVSLEIIKAKSSDLQSNYFVNKGYDILVYGISLNQATEPYAYWSSDAANPKGLNFSNYKSPANDADLDVARSKLNPAERNVRLERFVKRWKEDVPAAALYVPSLKVMYRSGSVQPDVNQQTYVSGFTDAFDLFNQIKGQKKKLYQN